MVVSSRFQNYCFSGDREPLANLSAELQKGLSGIFQAAVLIWSKVSNLAFWSNCFSVLSPYLFFRGQICKQLGLFLIFMPNCFFRSIPSSRLKEEYVEETVSLMFSDSVELRAYWLLSKENKVQPGCLSSKSPASRGCLPKGRGRAELDPAAACRCP